MKLISILILARPDRPDLITGCLQSLVDKTVDKSRLEVCVKVDKGDSRTFEAVSGFRDKLDLNISIVDGSRGRKDIAVYTNLLAKVSTGKLIWFWSDEVRMVTDGWDNLLQEYESCFKEFVLFLLPLGNVSGDVYLMITRRWLDVTGRWAGHPSVDCWVGTIQNSIPDIVRRVNLAGIRIKDVTFMGETQVPPNTDVLVPFDDAQVQAELENDINKIKQACSSQCQS